MESWVFLGNPGAGKSALVNCLAREPVVAAGLSLGSGKTTSTQSVERGGVRYIDTPGLADVTLQETAAYEITEALKIAAGGLCKLFFVVTLRNGRVRPEDIATISAILCSIDLGDVPFAVIVNNVEPTQYKRLMDGTTELKAVAASICSGRFSTPYIVIVPELAQLSEQENAVAELPAEAVRIFQEQLPSFLLEQAAVRPIKVDSSVFKSLVASSQSMIDAYTRDNQAAEARIQDLTTETSTFWETLLFFAQIWLSFAFGA